MGEENKIKQKMALLISLSQVARKSFATNVCTVCMYG
jgi:hypothetical protein